MQLAKSRGLTGGLRRDPDGLSSKQRLGCHISREVAKSSTDAPQ